MSESDYLGEASQSHADLEAVSSMLLLSLESSLDEVGVGSIAGLFCCTSLSIVIHV